MSFWPGKLIWPRQTQYLESYSVELLWEEGIEESCANFNTSLKIQAKYVIDLKGFLWREELYYTLEVV